MRSIHWYSLAEDHQLTDLVFLLGSMKGLCAKVSSFSLYFVSVSKERKMERKITFAFQFHHQYIIK